jgi:hypothetical protein
MQHVSDSGPLNRIWASVSIYGAVPKRHTLPTVPQLHITCHFRRSESPHVTLSPPLHLLSTSRPRKHDKFPAMISRHNLELASWGSSRFICPSKYCRILGTIFLAAWIDSNGPVSGKTLRCGHARPSLPSAPLNHVT